MKFYLPIFFVILSFALAYSQNKQGIDNKSDDSVLVIKESEIEKLYLLKSYCKFWIDESEKKTIAKVLEQEIQDRFEPLDMQTFDVEAPVLWLKCTIYNQSDKIIPTVIDFNYLEEVAIYHFTEDGKMDKILSGVDIPIGERGIKIYKAVERINLQKGKNIFYFRIQRNYDISIADWTIHLNRLSITEELEEYGLTHFSGSQRNFLLLFFGAIGLMFCYNIVIYFFLKDPNYLFYLLFVFFMGFYLFANRGLYDEWLLPNNPTHRGWILYIAPTLMIVFLLLFARRFLELKRLMPRVDILFWLIFFMLLFCFVLMLLGQYNYLRYYLGICSMCASIYLLAIAAILSIRKFKPAYFFLAGNSALVISGIVFSLKVVDILPNNFYTENALLMGILIQMSLFSLALANKINEAKKSLVDEKLKKVQEIKVLVEEKNRELEIQVIERTSQLRESNEEVKIKSRVLEEQNKEILDSISYAQRIQQSILPLAEDISKQFEEYFILFKPREIVSGDFYYFQPVDNKVILAVIDCTGHGVPGAFMSILGKEILDNIILERKILEADMIVNELHKGIRKALKQDQTENRDGMDLSLIVLHKETQYMEFAGAKNSLIYISDNQLHEIKGDKMDVGGEQKESERLFTKHQINISPNTTCYLFSDGYQDQFGGKEKKRFMIGRMKELLLEIHQLPMEEQRQILDLKIEDWMADGGERQIDDILMMGVRV